MRYSDSDAYIIERGGRKASSGRRRRRGGGRAAGVLVAVLLFLTAAICLLVVFLPRLSKSGSAVGAPVLSGKTYYFLCTAETENRSQALTMSHSTAERGGGGYIYNDGKYRIVAAVYSKESDVKTLVTVNTDSFYFSLGLGSGEYSSEDTALLNYLNGEWFDTLSTAATELDRGNITESAAEFAARRACDSLRELALNARSEKLKNAVCACIYDPEQSQSVLSYIRYIHVKMLISALCALT